MRKFPSILIQLTAFWVIIAGAQIGHAAYRDMGNGTVYDEERSLLWQKSDDGVKRYFVDALSYCNDLSLGGRENWELPSAESLAGLLDITFSPAINPVFSSYASKYFSSRIRSAIKIGNGVGVRIHRCPNGGFQRWQYYRRTDCTDRWHDRDWLHALRRRRLQTIAKLFELNSISFVGPNQAISLWPATPTD